MGESVASTVWKDSQQRRGALASGDHERQFKCSEGVFF